MDAKILLIAFLSVALIFSNEVNGQNNNNRPNRNRNRNNRPRNPNRGSGSPTDSGGPVFIPNRGSSGSGGSPAGSAGTVDPLGFPQGFPDDATFQPADWSGSLQPCGPNARMCTAIKKCVSLSRVCDGVDDCGDNSDERDCPGRVPGRDPGLTTTGIVCPKPSPMPVYTLPETDLDSMHWHLKDCGNDCFVQKNDSAWCGEYDVALDMKTWASELHEVLALGCSTPHNDCGTCCPSASDELMDAVTQMAGMMKAMYHVIVDSCDEFCGGGPDGGPDGVIVRGRSRSRRSITGRGTTPYPYEYETGDSNVKGLLEWETTTHPSQNPNYNPACPCPNLDPCPNPCPNPCPTGPCGGTNNPCPNPDYVNPNKGPCGTTDDNPCPYPDGFDPYNPYPDPDKEGELTGKGTDTDDDTTPYPYDFETGDSNVKGLLEWATTTYAYETGDPNVMGVLSWNTTPQPGAGPNPETAFKYPDSEWGVWGPWCSCDCQTGTSVRDRDCEKDIKKVDLKRCGEGAAREYRQCDVRLDCPACVDSCSGQPDGTYPGCLSCSNYVTCMSEEMTDGGECPMGEEFDGFSGKCFRGPSYSCSLATPLESWDTCMGLVDGRYPAPRCGNYVECVAGEKSEIKYCPMGQEYNHFTMQCEQERSPSCLRTVIGG